MRWATGTPSAPVEKLTNAVSPTSARIASVMARKSSTAWLGVPSGRRAWMWIITPPSSTIRRASAAYSAGVYGIAGHRSRPASAPEMAHVMMTGSSRSTPAATYRANVTTGSHRGSSRQRILPHTPRKGLPMIGAIILGIVAGFLGRLLMPGRDPMGFFATVLLGLAGALIGFFIFTGLLGIGDNDMFDLGGLVGAVIGVMILLGLYRAFLARRTHAGPAVR